MLIKFKKVLRDIGILGLVVFIFSIVFIIPVLTPKSTSFTSIPDVVPQVIPGVVHIRCPLWQGSGFVIGERLICTAKHIVDDVEDFTITTSDGHVLKAKRAFSFKEHDVGFIWIDDLRCVTEKEKELKCNKVKHEVKLHILEIASIKDCVLGQEVFAIGSPFGELNFNFLSSGIISSLNPDWSVSTAGKIYGWEVGWLTTVVGHPGNSGCPIFTLDGKVRGVLVAGLSPVLILAMPVDLFQDNLEEIKLMFLWDKYQKEQPPDPYYNYEDDNEYYVIPGVD